MQPQNPDLAPVEYANVVMTLNIEANTVVLFQTVPQKV